MKNNLTERKLRSGIGRTRHLISGVLCLAVISLICARASAQNLFVSVRDAGGGKIFEFTPDGVQSTFASGLNPGALAFDSAGNLFVVGGGPAIYKFSPEGVQSTFAIGLSSPRALAVDGAGNVFVANLGTNSILKFTPEGVRTTFASGLPDPEGLAFDGAGNLFVAAGRSDSLSTSGKIYKLTPGGLRTTFASDLYSPIALACDSRGSLFVADGGFDPYEGIWGAAVYKFTPSGLRSTVASQGHFVVKGTATSFVWGPNPVIPSSLACDSRGNLFVTDGVSGSILKFTPGGVRSVFASGVLGSLAVQPAQAASTPTPTPSPTATPTATPSPTPVVVAAAVSVTVSPTLVHKGGTAVFTISLSAASSNAVTVTYTMAGRARLGRHYTLSGSPGQVTIPAGANSADVTLTSLRAGKRPKTATLILMPGATYDLSASSTGSVIISR